MVAGKYQPLVDETDGIRVFDEWTEDVDLALDPETGQFKRRTPPLSARAKPRAPKATSRWLWAGFGIVASALFGSIGAVGALAALLTGAVAMAIVLLLFAPTIDVVLPPKPSLPTEMTVVIPQTPVAPSATKRQRRQAAPAEVEAQLVVMPDPGFRSQPLDKSIEELNKKADAGKIGVVSGPNSR